jgi:hypothetical protein
VDTFTEVASDWGRDALLDLDWEGAEGTARGACQAEPLPPLNPGELMAAMLPRLEAAVRRAAEAINADPWGSWSGLTQARVAAAFRGLGPAALEAALELRVAAAEALLDPGEQPLHQWASRYRRIMAREGQWPPRELSAQGSCRPAE